MSIKARLYPAPGQVPGLWRNICDARVVYNTALDERVYAWGKGVAITRKDQEHQLAQARRENSWLGEGSSSVQQQALRDLDRAFTNFFSNLKAGCKPGFPRHKKRNPRAGGFAVRDVSIRRLNRRWGEVSIPKVGRVRFRATRGWQDYLQAKSARVKLSNNRWHITFTTPPPQKKEASTDEPVGIDRGVTVTLADSTGGMYQMPGLTTAEAERYLRLEQKLARQKKDSANRAKTLEKMATIRAKVADRRRDFTEKTTTALAQRHPVVVMERLPTHAMVRKPSPKHSTDQPGAYLPNGASAKSKLARLIHSSWWGGIASRLEDKTTVMYVPARYTSQRCYACGHTEERNRDSQAVFCCLRCGHSDNADTNAAYNIRDSGMGVEPASWQCTAVNAHTPCPTRGQATEGSSQQRCSGARSQKTTPSGSENLQTTH